MNITFDLELLKLNNVTYDDETLRYNGYRLELWHGDLQKLADNLSAGRDFFFQTEMTINKGFLEQLELDIDITTYKLAEILFSNVQKAEALRSHFMTTTKFDEIEEESSMDNTSHTYDVGGTIYDVYYDKELMNFAQEISENYMRDSSIMELIGDIEYLDDYFDVIDTEGLAEYLRGEIKDRGQENDVSEKDFKDDKKILLWFAEEDEEYFLDMLEGYFDYGKMAEQMVDGVESAAAQVNGLDGEHIFSEEVSLDGYKTQYVHIFERF